MTGVCCAGNGCSSSDYIQLTEREMAVCGIVCASGTPVGFSQVKGSVELHQEIVSRILRRLVTYGAVEKENGKYRCGTGQ